MVTQVHGISLILSDCLTGRPSDRQITNTTRLSCCQSLCPQCITQQTIRTTLHLYQRTLCYVQDEENVVPSVLSTFPLSVQHEMLLWNQQAQQLANCAQFPQELLPTYSVLCTGRRGDVILGAVNFLAIGAVPDSPEEP